MLVNKFMVPCRVAGLILAVSVLIMSPTRLAVASEGPTSSEYGVVLNLSGKQRMLTQKMSKEILLIALAEESTANLANLKSTSDLFDKTLKGLRDGSVELGLPPTTNSGILRQLDKIDAIWADFYPVVKTILESGSVSSEQIAAVAKNNLPLLKQMNKAVGLYEKDAEKGGLKSAPGLAATINLSGKQRMLTQKMSKEFLLVAYGHDAEENKLSLLETYTLFERTLKGLFDGDETLGLPGTKQQEIRDQLEVVNGLWAKFKPIVEYGADYKTTSIPKDKISLLASGNLPLLKEMNKAVGMYEKEAAK
ncbi:MAG: type IV pili methyl-accepting chemotaxis transducer N-terminal domain-containing protein [Gammaproteobacteria bacterium]|nr:type IV pili methyl-accepting chemotaxis transducer N-terminal domain-containing protein [Gammaproteobacteria bacterium]MCP5407197.1 type IV pili methyl-accepting chemotaxis transducer N-terminal domain-containing protein [Chromatiaceae bacterium]MCP5408245.1 type IV pili methyl-accepting chemotaxis transducer N-terminal domain-containing protein [Chromatiaceae bacterium]MCP5442059.1 type IV pili methyl-accepting chemotaxis transducer N-terminal domain-containing protein [Chromatiaceae bacter